jgi:hypothetical protein
VQGGGFNLSVNNQVTLNAYADMGPNAPLSNLLPQMVLLLGQIASSNLAASVESILNQVPALASNSLSNSGYMASLYYEILLHSPQGTPPTILLPSLNTQTGTISRWPAGGGAGGPAQSAGSDDTDAPYKRKEVMERPYNEEPNEEPYGKDPDTPMDPGSDEPVEGDRSPSGLGWQAHEADELNPPLLLPINHTFFERILVRLPSGRDDTPGCASAPGINREGSHQDLKVGSVGDKFAYVSIVVGLTRPGRNDSPGRLLPVRQPRPRFHIADRHAHALADQ